MKPRRLDSDTSLSITSGLVLAGIVRRSRRDEVGAAGCGAARHLHGAPNSENYSGVELRAQPRRGWRRLSEQAGHDLVPMKATVLDEHRVRVEPRDDDPGDEKSRDDGLEGVGIMRRNTRHRIDRHALS